MLISSFSNYYINSPIGLFFFLIHRTSQRKSHMTFDFVKKRSQNNAVSEFSFTTLIILTINQGSDNKLDNFGHKNIL